ncbi:MULTISPECIES: DUF3102 domain-containing protein [Leptospira]|uniref:DUF3102 domain-containing protein n=1 Tax=Leptospira limi TaxID=2950023 RepID=A0ABT3M219_9LEPT|nr:MULTISPECIES: DUF3102 domain-containing protein [Leptospira]MCW7464023.1 DUF3102 domain-containing protein [Leptospira limi]TGK92481.1 DUF3102 domain-containing protein [Leptospira levettii]
MSKERSKLISSLTGKRPGEKEVLQLHTSIEDEDIQRINELHQSMLSNMSRAIQNAILIGEILTKKKSILSHGSFLPWLEGNVPFTRATAANYMRMYEKREILNVKRVLHLRDALKLLAEDSKSPKNEKVINRPIREIYKDFKSGKNLSKSDRDVVRGWLSGKVDSLKTKTKKLEDELKRLKS